jgi:hypothetical protein
VKSTPRRLQQQQQQQQEEEEEEEEEETGCKVRIESKISRSNLLIQFVAHQHAICTLPIDNHGAQDEQLAEIKMPLCSRQEKS